MAFQLIFKQLLKEFCIPFIAAIAWAAYSIVDGNKFNWSFALFIQSFGAAFFFISWLLAQYFRVKKQTNVETNLHLIHQNIMAVVCELKDATNSLIGYQIGGDSFCYLTIASFNKDTNVGIETIVHQGLHPLYDISARIVDLDKAALGLSKNLKNNGQFGTNRHFGELGPGFCKTGSIFNLGLGNQGRFNIFWVARNGGFTQLLRFKKINGQWYNATKVERGNKTLLEQIQEGYPRNIQGGIDW